MPLNRIDLNHLPLKFCEISPISSSGLAQAATNDFGDKTASEYQSIATDIPYTFMKG
ncbi:hypothetical protein DESC_940009 [Desulfosarcina cetonica]|nr:hypothetical protein DESC_940009 [Desulfosarcina cetonica]